MLNVIERTHEKNGDRRHTNMRRYIIAVSRYRMTDHRSDENVKEEL
jgi:hypothetical protein